MINNLTSIAQSPKYKYFNLHKNNPKSSRVSFGNKISIPQTPRRIKQEKFLSKIEYGIRVIGNKAVSLFASNDINKQYEELKNLDTESPEYIQKLYNHMVQMAGSKQVEINVENGALQDICNSKESCIFIMNHNNQKEDPRMLAFFYGLLAREYLIKGNPEKSPKPKIILNEDILNTAHPKTKEILEKYGVVGIDASLFNPNKVNNGKKLFPVIKDFISDAAHIFIFPEGKMCVLKNVDMDYKFQTGVADIVSKVSQRKQRVKVVPLGFGYKKDIGSIHIGTPIYFKAENDKILSTKGNSDSTFASDSYKKFFNKLEDTETFKVITECGEPVKAVDASDYIAGILCENLKISKAESEKAISGKSPEEIYCLGED